MEKKFDAQSYKNPSFTVIIDGEGVVPGLRLQKRVAGTRTEFTASGGGEWVAMPLNFSGKVYPSKSSAGEIILALASEGSWSGGSNYTGYVFGKPGAVLVTNRKGSKSWYTFTSAGVEESDFNPAATPVEV